MTKILFVMEIGLGHTTFRQNLQSAVAKDPEIEPVWVDVTFDSPGLLGRLPKLRHDHVLRAGLQAYQKVARVYRECAPDILFFHTQMPSVFCHGFLRRTPGVISMDATPKQFLALSGHYGFQGDPDSRLERRRDRWYRRAFGASSRLFTWSRWAADSLAADYGQPPAKVRVFPPGIDLDRWRPVPRPALGPDDPLRLLFVGSEFQRKGGDLLLRWMRESAPQDCSLDVVTREPVPPTPRVTVHSDLSANDPRLVALSQASDALVLPTRADCFSLAAMEAQACGLPVVISRVGGIPEIVVEGETGYLLPPDSYAALTQALDRLAGDRPRLRTMGQAARTYAESRFDGARGLADELVALKGLAPRREP